MFGQKCYTQKDRKEGGIQFILSNVTETHKVEQSHIQCLSIRRYAQIEYNLQQEVGPDETFGCEELDVWIYNFYSALI